ncbi:hypothetical protein [Paenibacillus sp.]|jgi:DNA-directed RNA polymerase delta subunit|uniref:hypothetical protein n=1 Tax=Paenibacillus sp. TaxID=58172 RepID=UPI00281B2045|nr:hypothetical protein [Paenibacillus sp.]MDR0268488.1 hypothetical protein [Paenibacillus sp.]
MSRIVVELLDLMKAEQELSKLLQNLQHNELHLRTITDGIQDWKGKSADELRSRLDVFFKGLKKQMEYIEEQKIELTKYTYRMERVDRQ